jgi:hypothetical protein
MRVKSSRTERMVHPAEPGVASVAVFLFFESYSLR